MGFREEIFTLRTAKPLLWTAAAIRKLCKWPGKTNQNKTVKQLEVGDREPVLVRAAGAPAWCCWVRTAPRCPGD